MVRGGSVRPNFTVGGSWSSTSTPAISLRSSEKANVTSGQSLGLHRAAATGNVAMVLYALENGESPNTYLNGIAPLHVSACLGDTVVTQILIAYGADLNLPRSRSRVHPTPGVEGSTGLHFAAANGHNEIVRILLENGAAPTVTDRDNQTPESLAHANHHSACAEALRRWIEKYGSKGWVAPNSIYNTGYAMRWGNEVVSPSPRSDSPELGRSLQERRFTLPSSSSMLVHHNNEKRFAPPALPRFQSDSQESLPQRSRTASPAPSESRWRASLPMFLEKAAHPASSLRALWPPTSSSSGNQPFRNIDEVDDSSSSVVRVPRISSRTGLSNFLKRATGSNTQTRSPEDTQSSLHREDGDLNRFSGMLSPTGIISLMNRRSQDNLSTSSTTDRSESPSLSRTSDALAVPVHKQRMRSSSVSVAHLATAPKPTTKDASVDSAIRARASSEVRPVPTELTMTGSLSSRSTSISPTSPFKQTSPIPSSSAVAREILDQGAAVDSCLRENEHSSLAILLARYGQTLQSEHR
ncbi:hypothetical protein MYAM1_001331 [Malassezia yamatoensis]|uniref:Ankyrin n=1 Tax=Malassezia yamatoensis TaxID=253288 RepID=A0AAJ5YTR1_9BASI|nr:hypothetical protein MYAM1_001331 [Malassezia yamatoensis]